MFKKKISRLIVFKIMMLYLSYILRKKSLFMIKMFTIQYLQKINISTADNTYRYE